ncbi:uncharacterized protein [Clytia hemisphaerica]|uniref:uncharacterized protein n=1 Tax=Clytia hemisphaerica TaxID=252671 RepID=UPI0034D4FA1F
MYLPKITVFDPSSQDNEIDINFNYYGISLTETWDSPSSPIEPQKLPGYHPIEAVEDSLCLSKDDELSSNLAHINGSINTPNIQGSTSLHLESTPSGSKCHGSQNAKQCLEFFEETMTASENEDVLTASEVSDNSADEATDTASEHSDEVLDSDIDNLEEYL